MTVKPIKLNDGYSMPAVTFGTGGIAFFLKECSQHVHSALDIGYGSLDSAEIYGNAPSIKQGMKAWGGKRQDVYIMTKCMPNSGGFDGEASDPREYLLKALGELGVSYVDMYIIHFPHAWGPLTLSQVWKIMESLKEEGLTRSIGVCNFQEKDIKEIEGTWTIPPAINQIELHPYIIHHPKYQRLLSLLHTHDIKVSSYVSLGPVKHYPGHRVDEIVARVAGQKGEETTSEQVLIAWALAYSQGGVVTTSRDPVHRAEYLSAGQLMPALTRSEVDEISLAGKSFVAPFRQPFWNPGTDTDTKQEM